MTETAAAGLPVVVTRPLAQAGVLRDRLLALGRQVEVFPLLEITRLADHAALDTALADLRRYALVAFVSPNAIDAALARRPDWPRGVPLAVMGEGSRRALLAHGIDASSTPIVSPTDPQRTDSQTLLAALDLPALRGREVLILRGESGRELLADGLRAAGAIVRQVAAYSRRAPELDAAGWHRLRGLLEHGAEWIITSSEALHFLLQMAQTLDGADGHAGANDGGADASEFVVKLQHQTLIVPHLRIAETARALGFYNVIRTGSGDERLLAALQFRNE